ncbi:transposase, partial [Paraphaeosphaeria sporulosa]
MPKAKKQVSSYIADTQIVDRAVVELQALTRPDVTAYCRDRDILRLRKRIYYALSTEQELALIRFCDAIDDVGFGITRELVQQQADFLLADAHDGDDPPRVGTNWASRWLSSQPKYYRTKAKPMDLARKLAQSPEAILAWYRKLWLTEQRLGISDANKYNMDETGIRIGVAKDSFVYTRRGREVLIPTATNRELISLVECVSATGVSLPPMLIMKAKTILEQWVVNLPSDYLINITNSGYANDQTAIDWIKHFNKMTAAATLPKTWRLLLIDRHGSHLTAELANFYKSHYIQLYALPPHTTHLLQPLDVGCFQPLKWYHSRTLDWASRTGA